MRIRGTPPSLRRAACRTLFLSRAFRSEREFVIEFGKFNFETSDTTSLSHFCERLRVWNSVERRGKYAALASSLNLCGTADSIVLAAKFVPKGRAYV